MHARTRIMGVDPSLAATGVVVCIIGDAGELTPVYAETIRTTRADKRLHRCVGEDDAIRAGDIARALVACMHASRVDVVAVELPVGSQSARSARTSGIVIGVVGTLAQTMAQPVVWLTPHQCKRAITGSVAGSKQQVATGVLQVIPGLREWLKGAKPVQEAICDAAAACIAARHTEIVRAVRQGRSEL